MAAPMRILAAALLFALGACPTAAAEAAATNANAPILYDLMTFVNKPDLGLSTDLGMVYAWEATYRDGAATPYESERTIEPIRFSSVVRRQAGHKFIAIDIERLKPSDDPIAIRYVQLAKLAAPDSKIAWWNVGPRHIVDTVSHPFDEAAWYKAFEARRPLIDENDFAIIGAYIGTADTIETWTAKHIPRIAETRRLYGSKPVIFALMPQYPDKGKPWPFIDGRLLGAAMDALAANHVDGILLWSFEGTGQIQPWNGNRSWVQAVLARTGPDGRYRKPTNTP